MPTSVCRIPLSDMGNIQSELTPNTKQKLDVDIRKQLQERRMRMDADYARARRAPPTAPVIAEDPAPAPAPVPVAVPVNIPKAPSPQRAAASPPRAVESKHVSPRRPANPIPLPSPQAAIPVAPVPVAAPKAAEPQAVPQEKKERKRIKLDGTDGVVEKVCLLPERRQKKEHDMRQKLLAKKEAKEDKENVRPAARKPAPAAEMKPLPRTGAIPPPRLSGSPVRDVRREVGQPVVPTQERLNALNALMSPPRPAAVGVRGLAPPPPAPGAYAAAFRAPLGGHHAAAAVPPPTRYGGYGVSAALPLPTAAPLAGIPAPMRAPAPAAPRMAPPAPAVPRGFTSDLDYARYVAQMEYGF